MVLVVTLVTLLCPPPDSRSNATTHVRVHEIYLTCYPEIILRGNLLRDNKRGKVQECPLDTDLQVLPEEGARPQRCREVRI